VYPNESEHGGNGFSAMFAVAVAPLVAVTVTEPLTNPAFWAVMAREPVGTSAKLYVPFAAVVVVNDVPETVMVAPAIGAPPAAFVTVPDTTAGGGGGLSARFAVVVVPLVTVTVTDPLANPDLLAVIVREPVGTSGNV
jgi:hypothetical protein